MSPYFIYNKNIFAFNKFEWPSGQRCQLEGLSTRVLFPPKSQLSSVNFKVSNIIYRFELNYIFFLNGVRPPDLFFRRDTHDQYQDLRLGYYSFKPHKMISSWQSISAVKILA